MESIPEYTHKINERLELLRETDSSFLRVRILRIKDGWFFDTQYNHFVDSNGDNFAGDIEDYWYTFNSFDYVPALKSLSIVTLPSIVQDLLFEFQTYETMQEANPAYDPADPESTEPEFFDVIDPTTVSTWYERHVFGGAPTISEPNLCKVYGTLKDVSGKPLAGQKVEAYLNKAGFFTHKAGLIGYAATALTDDTGYFELPLVIGLDVTINLPIVGFTTRGYVPNVGSVELTTQTLLSYQPG